MNPDLVSVGKALAGGVPMGAALVKEEVAAALSFGDHGTTFGGNLLACRAALVCLDELTAGLMDHVKKVGAHLEAQLREMQKKHPAIVEIRGAGLMWGLELNVRCRCRARSRHPAGRARQSHGGKGHPAAASARHHGGRAGSSARIARCRVQRSVRRSHDMKKPTRSARTSASDRRPRATRRKHSRSDSAESAGGSSSAPPAERADLAHRSLRRRRRRPRLDRRLRRARAAQPVARRNPLARRQREAARAGSRPPHRRRAEGPRSRSAASTTCVSSPISRRISRTWAFRSFRTPGCRRKSWPTAGPARCSGGANNSRW